MVSILNFNKRLLKVFKSNLSHDDLPSVFDAKEWQLAVVFIKYVLPFVPLFNVH